MATGMCPGKIDKQSLSQLSCSLHASIIPRAEDRVNRTVQLDANTVEIEERGVKLRLTVVDTPGFGDAIDNSDSFEQIIKYIDQQFENYLQVCFVVCNLRFV